MKDLKIEDKDEVSYFLNMANYEGYNSHFITMMMWNHEYHVQYEIHDCFMVMLHDYKGLKFWSMPFTTKEYYQQAIDYMIEYSQNHHFDFMIDCATEEFVHDLLQTDTKKRFLVERTPYNDDYIYDRHMHQTLSGKKMQKRRNHYNFFIKNYPRYEYRDLDPLTDFQKIYQCLIKWQSDKDGFTESMSSEILGIMTLLSYHDFLDFKAGGIFIDDVMEAFIIASPLHHSTIQIHVEKANKKIRGLYPAILKELLEHHFEGYEYINREEDMGLDNLRKSKESLYPIKMIRKHRITLKKPIIRIAENQDTDEIKQLWQERFDDENQTSTDFYFNHYYHKENTYIYQNSNQIISVIQIVPMTLSLRNKHEECYFILGVTTNKNFEGQGCMKELLSYILEQYEGKRIYLQAYVPEIYHRFGFTASHLHQQIILDKASLQDSIYTLTDDKTLLNSYYQAYTSHFDEYKIRNKNDWDLIIKRTEIFNQKLVIFKNLGYIIYEENNEDILISEFVYINKEAANSMLAYFKHSPKNIIVECDMEIVLKGETKNVIAMMSNQDHHEDNFKHKYINEVY